MYKLIVYGSLMNEDELQNQGLWGHNTELVKVFGYQRVFNQEPSYRLIDSNNRAVLSIQANANAWFNAVMIKDLDEAFFEALDMREIGYERIKVECKTYKGDFYKDCFVYMGKSDKHNESIAPNEEYLKLCLQGVKALGKIFHEDFINTTYKNTHEGLKLINQ
jgi:gamma-glutamylcyclotransferase (GGCT)/AIG2-like uncharacterized protein YtfP